MHVVFIKTRYTLGYMFYGDYIRKIKLLIKCYKKKYHYVKHSML